MLLLPNEPRPDWRRGEFYPSPNDTVQLHAWEFLRRNPKFAEEIGPHVERLCAAHAEWFDSPTDYYGWVVRWGEVIGELIGNEETLAILRRWGIIHPGIPAEVSEGGEHYSRFIGRLSPAEFCDPLIGYTYWLDERKYKKRRADGRVEIFDPIVEFRFDVRLPIGPQLRELEVLLMVARSWIAEIAPREVTKRINDGPELFPHYLRVLDARTDGLTFAEIAEKLSQELGGDEESFEESLVRKQHKKALELRDFGYRRIAFLDPEFKRLMLGNHPSTGKRKSGKRSNRKA